MGIQDEICAAIKERKVIKFTYGREIATRTFEPFVVYKTKSKHIHVSGFQSHNTANPLDKRGWRNFEVADITSLVVTDEVFTLDQSFNPSNTRYAAGVICYVV